MSKAAFITANTIAYHSSFAGIEIKSIEYGIEDYVIFVAGAWCSKKTVHKSKIYYSKRSYFKFYNTRIYLDECIKC